MKLPKKLLCLSLYPKSFFKVFLPDQSSHLMKFPPAFIKYINGTVPFRSTISTKKSSWLVDLEKINGSLYFHNGWEQFVGDNSLNYGDFLIFTHSGDEKFYVEIYGKDGCQKKETLQTSEAEIFPIPEDNQIDEKKELAFPDNIALEEASKFKSSYPFFKVLMKPSYVTYTTMHIPSSFANRRMTRYVGVVTLLYLDKAWPVKMIRNGASTRRFSHGWVTFAKDNALKAGDVCIFELVDRNDFVFKASIFRCSA